MSKAMTSDYFHELTNPSSIYSHLLSLASDQNGWYNNYGFDMKNVPDNILRLDTTLAKIIDKFDYQKYASRSILLKLNPFIFYKLHTDTERTCAINLLLKGQGITFSGENVEGNDYLHTVNQLVYRPQHYYLLNTQKSHAVLNLEGERILFSVTFTAPYDYDGVKSFIVENSL